MIVGCSIWFYFGASSEDWDVLYGLFSGGHPGALVSGASLLALVGFCGVVYFVPTFIVCKKKSKHAAAVAALNVLLGWTLIGWVGALIWAVAEPEMSPIQPKMKCPYCLNEINYGARICQFCHTRFV